MMYKPAQIDGRKYIPIALGVKP